MSRYRSIAAVTLMLNLIFGISAYQAQAVPDSGGGIACVLDIVVETRGSTGAVSTKRIQREFVMQEGQTISEDLSTRTRFEFLDAAMVKEKGDKTTSVNRFADTSVFHSVDFETSVLPEDGDKFGRAVGSNTFYTSTLGIRTQDSRT